jgi:hypothetical protein
VMVMGIDVVCMCRVGAEGEGNGERGEGERGEGEIIHMYAARN